MPESAHGPTNNCIGIGNVLRRRGHRVVFAAEASWRGKLERTRLRGGPRRPAPRRPRTGRPSDAGQFWKDFIRDTAPEFRKPTIEQLDDVHAADLAGAHRRRDVLRAAAARDPRPGPRPTSSSRTTSSPFPRCMTAGAPYVRIVSCNPLEVPGPGIAPVVLRSAGATTAREWAAFRAEYDRTHRQIWAAFNEWVSRAGRAAAAGPRVHATRPSTPTSTSSRTRRTTPTRVRSTRPGTGWTPASARPTTPSSVPAQLADRPEGSALVYLSLGSLGSADVDLMRRLVDVLGATPAPLHRSQGSAARRVRARRQHVGRGVRAADHGASRRSTSSSRTAATTRRPRRCTSASR